MAWVMVPLLVLLVGILVATLFARRRIDWLRRQPDPYGLELLAKDPDGTEEFVRCPDGTTLRVVSKGTGTPVIFAHGLAANLLEWNVVWSALSPERYRLIAFDQRGHGQSTVGSEGMSSAAMASDFRVLLDHFDVRDGILVGHSLGGFLTMVFLAQHAEIARARLRGALLVATFAGAILQGHPDWDPAPSKVPWQGTWKERVGFGYAALLAWSGLMPWLMGTSFCIAASRGLMGTRPFWSAMVMGLKMMRVHTLKRSLPIIRAAFFEDHYPALGSIPIPCVALYGEADTAARPWHAHRIARRIPNARAVAVPGSGHLMNWEAPQAIVEAIDSLASVQVRAVS